MLRYKGCLVLTCPLCFRAFRLGILNRRVQSEAYSTWLELVKGRDTVGQQNRGGDQRNTHVLYSSLDHP
jgi:hypothetical protein